MNYLEKFSLKTKTCFVVGGLGLIGKSVTEALLKSDAKILLLDINKKQILKEKKKYNYNKKVNIEYFDLSDISKIESGLKKIIKKYGVPDVFINCSYPRTKDFSTNNFSELKLNSLNQNIKIHLNSYIWIARLIAEEMKRASIKGSIIQFSSIYGLRSQDLSIYKGTNMRENLTYAAIKGGINNVTKLFCSYYGKYKIRINNIAPGGLEGHVAGSRKKQEKKFIDNYSSKVPLRRLGKPEEIAPAVIFLSSDASSYITGTTLIIDGGWTAI